MKRRTAVGIDLGTIDVFAANVGRKGVEVCQNAVSERRTPALVSFTDKRRLLGEAAFAQVRSNYKNSCRGLKQLIGRAVDSPEVEAERRWSLCPLGRAADGDVGFEVSCRGEKQCVSALVCLSMLLVKVVQTCEAWTNMEVRDVVLAIPPFFAERHRQACLDAVRIAGVHCLRLVHESTAIALAWRYERMGFDDTIPMTVAFVSCGHSCLTVFVARYENKGVVVLGEAYDLAVSGRSMDRILMEMFADSMKKQGSPDPLASMKSQLKLEEVAMKVKKTLSSSESAMGTAECVVEDYDLACEVKKSVFEERCAPLAGKVQAVVDQALAAAGLAFSDLTQVEMVGGCSRVPWVQKALQGAFGGMEISTTLNADEAVAKGCAWQAAMLSPLIRLNPIPQIDFGHLALALEWDSSLGVEAEGSTEEENRRRLTIFDAGAGPGAEAEVGLKCTGKINLEVKLVYVSDESLPPVSSWKLSIPGQKQEVQDVELQCALDLNGVFSIKKAAVVTEKEPPAPVLVEPEAAGDAGTSADGSKAEDKAAGGEDGAGDAAKAEEVASASAGDEATQDQDASKDEGADRSSKDEGAESASKDEGAEDGSKDLGKEPDNADGAEGVSKDDGADKGFEDQEPEEIDFGESASPPKKRFSWVPNMRFWQWRRGSKDNLDPNGDPAAAWSSTRKVGGTQYSSKAKRINVEVAALARLGYDKKAFDVAIKAEDVYRATEEAIIMAENGRNDYETLIFKLRNQASSGEDVFAEYVSPEEKAALLKELDASEDWTYEHTDEVASVYGERTKTLNKKPKEFARRKSDMEAIYLKAKALRASIRKYKASANAPMFDHIAKEKLDAIVEECDKEAQWLNGCEARQNLKQKWEPFELSNAELTTRNTELVKNSTKTLTEPRPKIAPKEEKKEKKDDAEGAEAAEGAEGTAEEKPKPVTGWRKFVPSRRVFLIGGGIAAIIASVVGATYFGLVERDALMPGTLLRTGMSLFGGGGGEEGEDIEDTLAVEDPYIPEAEEL